ncbi:hypothetical protein GOP47_0028113 [Adiantum capillus-veneris]|nr:hypothetical protein GOP47_0028113 [Adiantum capillus-veneris]
MQEQALIVIVLGFLIIPIVACSCPSAVAPCPNRFYSYKLHAEAAVPAARRYNDQQEPHADKKAASNIRNDNANMHSYDQDEDQELPTRKLSTEIRKSTSLAEKEAELRVSLNRAAEQLRSVSMAAQEGRRGLSGRRAVAEKLGGGDHGKDESSTRTLPRVLHDVPSGPNPISNSLPGT